jgi:hypothetical protein
MVTNAIAAKNTITKIVVFAVSLICEEFEAITLSLKGYKILSQEIRNSN